MAGAERRLELDGMPTGDRVRLVAPAKLTVSLRVLGTRLDGLHQLVAEMVTLDLVDELELQPGGDGLAVQWPATQDDSSAHQAQAVPHDGQNLVLRALQAVGRRAQVRLVKRIPVGGGLGGGSADAAAVLRWAGCQDPSVALALGSDVPFCVIGGRALVQGVGEQIQRLPFLPCAYVLVVPPFGVSTAAVYRKWDALAAMGQLPPQGANDLTAPALAVEPRLARWRDLLGEFTGAEPVLAGSGSTWFVPGDRQSLGIDNRPFLADGDLRGRLLEVRTVPSGWGGEAAQGH